MKRPRPTKLLQVGDLYCAIKGTGSLLPASCSKRGSEPAWANATKATQPDRLCRWAEYGLKPLGAISSRWQSVFRAGQPGNHMLPQQLNPNHVFHPSTSTSLLFPGSVPPAQPSWRPLLSLLARVALRSLGVADDQQDQAKVRKIPFELLVRSCLPTRTLAW